MKKRGVLFVLVLISGIFFDSCTKEDSGTVDMSLIGGKWLFDKSKVSSSGITIPFTTPYFKNEDGCDKDYIEMLKGGVVKYGDWGLNCVFKGKDGSWSQSENTLIINVDGTGLGGTFDVVSLSSNEMTLKINGEYLGKSGTLYLSFIK